VFTSGGEHLLEQETELRVVGLRDFWRRRLGRYRNRNLSLDCNATSGLLETVTQVARVGQDCSQMWQASGGGGGYNSHFRHSLPASELPVGGV